MTILWLDFETRSRCGLKTAGVYNYAQDASTEVLCMSYAFDNEDVQTWYPTTPFPERVAMHDGQIRAHNAAFERLILWYVCQTDHSVEQFYCTATQARANCLPAALEDVPLALGLQVRKDARGKQLIRALCVPQLDGTFMEDPQLLAELAAYCEQDVVTMRAVSRAMRDLSATELRDYHVSERINDRGLRVDVPLCQAAVRYADAEGRDLEAEVAEITDGVITTVRSPKMREWVYERVGPEAKRLMTTYKDGEAKVSIDKAVRANLLALGNPDEVPADVADVIQCADDLWASSVAKFGRLANLADVEDARVRGAFVFAGGSATGRYSSYGAQLHNFARQSLRDADEARQALVRGHAVVPRFGKRTSDVLKGMLRPAILPKPGYSLVVADWNAIEARLTAWLSADRSAEKVLEVFRSGGDIYKREASGIYRVREDEVTDEQRQVGKVAILALGFAGSVGAFAAMGRAYKIALPESDTRRIVDAWRANNAWAVRYWSKLEEAYMTALRNPGREVTAARVTYLYDKQHLWYALPSGRILCYPFAKVDDDGVTYVKAAWRPAAGAKEWPRARLWKGLACENITQAAAADLLREALAQLDDVVAHVHDEIVLEVPTEAATFAAERLNEVMCNPPAWAEGLPLKAEVKIKQRYGK